MAIITPSVAVRNAILTAIKTALEVGTQASTIAIYTGAKPSGPDSSVTSQIKLGTLTFSDTSIGSVSNGELTFGAITQDTSADNTGTATWARMFDGNGLAVIDVDVGTIGGNAFLQMNTVAVVATGPITMSSCVIRV